MATLYITEYATVAIAQINGSIAQAPHEPPLIEQTVSIGGSSTQSSAFNANTAIIRIETDSICSILVGTNPTALTTSARFIAGQTEYRSIPKGQHYKVAVISNS